MLRSGQTLSCGPIQGERHANHESKDSVDGGVLLQGVKEAHFHRYRKFSDFLLFIFYSGVLRDLHQNIEWCQLA